MIKLCGKELLIVILFPKNGNEIFAQFFLYIYNWDSLHARLTSHYEAWSHKKNKHKKIKAYRKVN